MATRYWNNTTNFWQTASGWTQGILPGPGDTAIVGQGATSGFTVVAYASPVSVGSVILDGGILGIEDSFSAATFIASSGSLVIASGGALTVSGGFTVSGGYA